MKGSTDSLLLQLKREEGVKLVESYQHELETVTQACTNLERATREKRTELEQAQAEYDNTVKRLLAIDLGYETHIEFSARWLQYLVCAPLFWLMLHCWHTGAYVLCAAATIGFLYNHRRSYVRPGDFTAPFVGGTIAFLVAVMK